MKHSQEDYKNHKGLEMTKRKMGRPPAPWMFELATLKKKDRESLDYQGLCDMFCLSKRMVQNFCSKLEIPGEYYQAENKTVQKRFRVSELKKAAKRYISERGYD